MAYFVEGVVAPAFTGSRAVVGRPVDLGAVGSLVVEPGNGHPNLVEHAADPAATERWYRSLATDGHAGIVDGLARSVETGPFG